MRALAHRAACKSALSVFCVLVAASVFVACKNSESKARPASSAEGLAGAGPSAASVQQSLDGLKVSLGTLNGKFADLRKQVEATPPETPGFADVRAKFYAADEGLGITGAKVSWLSKRLDAATANPAERQSVSNDIAHTYEEIQQIDRIGLALLHQLLPFQDATSDAAPEKKP